MPAPASSGDGCRPDDGERVAIAGLVDPLTLTLIDGRIVRLDGIFLPRPQAYAPALHRRIAASRDEAAGLLDKLASGREAILFQTGRETDRHGRILAQVTIAGSESGVPAGSWLQMELVTAGLALAMPSRASRSCMAGLLESEARARRAGRGLWSDTFTRIRDARDTRLLLAVADSYQIVEGAVHAVAERRDRTYLNFDEDWRTDFTILVSGRNRSYFERGPKALTALEGRRIRVRGWVERMNGPLIRVSYPEQIEILENGSDAGPRLP